VIGGAGLHIGVEIRGGQGEDMHRKPPTSHSRHSLSKNEFGATRTQLGIFEGEGI
jgi:hypothetical protein